MLILRVVYYPERRKVTDGRVPGNYLPRATRLSNNGHAGE